MLNKDNYFMLKNQYQMMKFIILKLDCNHDIWVLEGGKRYLYSLVH